MKKTILITLFASLSLGLLYSQRVDTIYYNSKDQVVTKKKYDYYRIARQDSDRVKVFDYSKSGKIKMSGAFKTFNFTEETGPFYYYSNKRVTQLEIHQPSQYPEIYNKYKSFLDNMPKQPDSLKLIITFYKNYSVQSIGYASDCCNWYGPYYTFTKNGELFYLETYLSNKLDGPFILYFNNSPLIIGQYKNGKKEGEWQYYTGKKKLEKTTIYKDGKVVNVIR
jgi:antitoxin component YwqK of YwqJK toxin-antitoxin module